MAQQQSSFPSQYILYKNLNTPGFIESYSQKRRIDDFVNELAEGDIIFSRSDTWIGKIIQHSSQSIWSHVGMCVVDPQTGLKCYWESANGSDDENLPQQCKPLYGGGPRGVRMWPIKNRLEYMLAPDTNGNGKSILFAVAKMSLLHPVPFMQYSSRLHEFVKSKTGTPYQNNYSVLFFAWFDGMPTLSRYFCGSKNIVESESNGDYDIIDDRASFVTSNASPSTSGGGYTTAYFCSELIVDTLINMGLMIADECPVCSEWTVDDLFHVKNINKFIHCGVYYKMPTMYLVNK
jgi:hypothetical protein